MRTYTHNTHTHTHTHTHMTNMHPSSDFFSFTYLFSCDDPQNLHKVFHLLHFRPGVSNVLIILTDGKPTVNVSGTQAARDQLVWEDGLEVYAFGITEGISPGNLSMLAGSNYWHVPDFTVSIPGREGGRISNRNLSMLAGTNYWHLTDFTVSTPGREGGGITEGIIPAYLSMLAGTNYWHVPDFTVSIPAGREWQHP